MFLTSREKRRIIVGVVLLVIIVAFAIAGYNYMNGETISAPSTAQKTETPSAAKQEDMETKEEKEALGITSYTQYSQETDTCIYYYEKSQCYVPLSFCVLEPDVKTPQELDKDKYCSKTPELSVEALKSPAGSACPFTATEGDLVNLKTIVRDPDEDDPTYPIGPLGKLEVSFSDPFNDNNGVWKTQKGSLGVHRFKVSVTDGEYVDEEPYCVEVKQGNRPPALSNLRDMTVAAGEIITLNPSCKDPDNDPVTISYMGGITDREWMTSNTKKTTYKDVGKHFVTVTCRDNRGLPAYKTITIIVLPTPPGQTSTLRFILEPRDVTVREGETITLNPQAESSLGEPVTLAYSGWMTSNTRELSYADAGEYRVTITATDGISTLKKTITITVLNVNRPPEIVSTTQI